MDTTSCKRRLTADEVLRMVEAGILDEGERLELIDGELVVMSPQNPPHATTTERVAMRLHAAYAPSAHVRRHSPVVASSYNMPEPDIAVVRGSLDDYDVRHPAASDVLLVVEVSHTTQRMDRLKASVYGRGGVPVMWLLDLEARQLEVHSGPGEAGYESREILGLGERVALPQLDVAWPVSELFR